MDPHEVRSHWTDLAKEHGIGLKATTRAATAKRLEIAALRRHLGSLHGMFQRPLNILEVGCGNGQNLIALAQDFSRSKFLGIDYVPEMIAAARTARDGHDGLESVAFEVGDALSLDVGTGQWDVVISDRCLINLDSFQSQAVAVRGMIDALNSRGTMLLIENMSQAHARQNQARELLGLPPRTPATFNLFVDEERLQDLLREQGMTFDTEDFISLHDVVLYVLLPAVNGGMIEYDHPLVEAAAHLSAAYADRDASAFGSFGQNRLYRCHKGESR